MTCVQRLFRGDADKFGSWIDQIRVLETRWSTNFRAWKRKLTPLLRNRNISNSVESTETPSFTSDRTVKWEWNYGIFLKLVFSSYPAFVYAHFFNTKENKQSLTLKKAEKSFYTLIYNSGSTNVYIYFGIFLWSWRVLHRTNLMDAEKLKCTKFSFE